MEGLYEIAVPMSDGSVGYMMVPEDYGTWEPDRQANYGRTMIQISGGSLPSSPSTDFAVTAGEADEMLSRVPPGESIHDVNGYTFTPSTGNRVLRPGNPEGDLAAMRGLNTRDQMSEDAFGRLGQWGVPVVNGGAFGGADEVMGTLSDNAAEAFRQELEQQRMDNPLGTIAKEISGGLATGGAIVRGTGALAGSTGLRAPTMVNSTGQRVLNAGLGATTGGLAASATAALDENRGDRLEAAMDPVAVAFGLVPGTIAGAAKRPNNLVRAEVEGAASRTGIPVPRGMASTGVAGDVYNAYGFLQSLRDINKGGRDRLVNAASDLVTGELPTQAGRLDTTFSGAGARIKEGFAARKKEVLDAKTARRVNFEQNVISGKTQIGLKNSLKNALTSVGRARRQAGSDNTNFSDLTELQNLVDRNTASYQGLKSARDNIAARAGGTNSRLNEEYALILDALDREIENNVRKAAKIGDETGFGGSVGAGSAAVKQLKGLELQEQAVDAHAANLERLITGADEKAIGILNDLARGGSRGNIEELRRLKGDLPPETWKSTSGFLIGQLGTDGDGAFQVNTFLREWNKYSAEAKRELFEPEHMAQLNDVSVILNRLKDVQNESPVGSQALMAGLGVSGATIVSALSGTTSAVAALVANVGLVTLLNSKTGTGYYRDYLRSVEKTQRTTQGPRSDVVKTEAALRKLGNQIVSTPELALATGLTAVGETFALNNPAVTPTPTDELEEGMFDDDNPIIATLEDGTTKEIRRPANFDDRTKEEKDAYVEREVFGAPDTAESPTPEGSGGLPPGLGVAPTPDAAPSVSDGSPMPETQVAPELGAAPTPDATIPAQDGGSAPETSGIPPHGPVNSKANVTFGTYTFEWPVPAEWAGWTQEQRAAYMRKELGD